MLSPYKEHCRYLKSAELARPNGGPLPSKDGTSCLVLARGDFAIPESCYIDATGHLNSVELNICYNQLLYVILGQSIASEVVPELCTFSLDHYRERRLPDVLIYNLSVAFTRVIDPKSFRGELAITRADSGPRSVKVKTHISFWDENGGEAHGDVSVAILKP
jgi:hypothetical protein